MLTSINHTNFNKLIHLTGSYNKAYFTDKLIYWWQYSKYRLDDEKIWFTRSYKKMAEESNCSERTVHRYLKELQILGLVERKTKLSVDKTGGFKVIKRTYIRVTDKLVGFIQNPSLDNLSNNPVNQSQGGVLEQQTCTFSTQVVSNDTDNKSLSYNKDKNNKPIVNNTVNQDSFVKNSPPKSTFSSLYPYFNIEKQIGEQLSERSKNYIKGMLANIQKQWGVKLSSPEQVFAEIAFCVLNQAQLKGIDSFEHRIQIIAKLLREHRWKTPKGFYNHSEFGALFKKMDPEKVTLLSNTVLPDKYTFDKSLKSKQQELNLLMNEILSNQRQLNELKAQPTTIHQALIDVIEKQLLQQVQEKKIVEEALETIQLSLTPYRDLSSKPELDQLIPLVTEKGRAVDPAFNNFHEPNKRSFSHAHPEEVDKPYDDYKTLLQELQGIEAQLPPVKPRNRYQQVA